MVIRYTYKEISKLRKVSIGFVSKLLKEYNNNPAFLDELLKEGNQLFNISDTVEQLVYVWDVEKRVISNMKPIKKIAEDLLDCKISNKVMSSVLIHHCNKSYKLCPKSNEDYNTSHHK
jgi:hypothetical protein